jgi:hypothetical protein
MGEDDKTSAEWSEKIASRSANCSLIAQRFRTANDGKPFEVPKRGRWQDEEYCIRDRA